MTYKPKDKKAARALQRQTGWPYSKCLPMVRAYTPGQIQRKIAESKRGAPLTATVGEVANVREQQDPPPQEDQPAGEPPDPDSGE